ncbi:hypothetical protein K437DRAFT_268511 [Tilletiaria anomala UBC 951]|uniref:ARM repeat-containing protein n=1 Tax=Tilletiaria anomala (strain ATCC 24038 / CBS 436.72 / UBC 951) TaxID=1037660 RepID=A0A066W395_TILAU|nr:uncharacterized protein K437DRAFT_268511 [Tilletiaria anomala UBC 951]KDN45250.1 hypothetical protein K437DRAFT_268511 [Tilletiaria anomala UBC 951]
MDTPHAQGYHGTSASAAAAAADHSTLRGRSSTIHDMFSDIGSSFHSPSTANSGTAAGRSSSRFPHANLCRPTASASASSSRRGTLMLSARESLAAVHGDGRGQPIIDVNVLEAAVSAAAAASAAPGAGGGPGSGSGMAAGAPVREWSARPECNSASRELSKAELASIWAYPESSTALGAGTSTGTGRGMGMSLSMDGVGGTTASPTTTNTTSSSSNHNHNHNTASKSLSSTPRLDSGTPLAPGSIAALTHDLQLLGVHEGGRGSRVDHINDNPCALPAPSLGRNRASTLAGSSARVGIDLHFSNSLSNLAADTHHTALVFGGATSVMGSQGTGASASPSNAVRRYATQARAQQRGLPFSIGSLAVSPRMSELPVSVSDVGEQDDYFTTGILRTSQPAATSSSSSAGAGNSGGGSPSAGAGASSPAGISQPLASVALMNRLGSLNGTAAAAASQGQRPRASTMLPSSSPPSSASADGPLAHARSPSSANQSQSQSSDESSSSRHGSNGFEHLLRSSTSSSSTPATMYALELSSSLQGFDDHLGSTESMHASAPGAGIGGSGGGGIGRARAGTLAALSGPGSRQRAEREMLRMVSHNASSASAVAAALDVAVAGGRASPGTSSSGGGALFRPPLLEEGVWHDAALGSRQASVQAWSGNASVEEVEAPVASDGAAGSGSGSRTGGGNLILSRSLWIGNLDPGVTAQDLMHAFAGYGAIESLRLLAEKDCGFVNFKETEDAKRAREDVLTRLGGMIPTISGKQAHPVRIGFGRIDTPGATGANWPYVGANSQATAVLSAAANAEVDGPATRALWLGSIPATTSQAVLLNIFTQYGPVESVRVLSQKNCAFINFERLEDSVRARKALNGREILGPEVGTVRVGFAKAPPRAGEEGSATTAGPVGAPSTSVFGSSNADRAMLDLLAKHHQQLKGALQADRQAPQSQQDVASVQVGSASSGNNNHFSAVARERNAAQGLVSASNSIAPSSDKGGIPLPPDMVPRAFFQEQQDILRELDGNSADEVDIDLASRPPVTYYASIPSITDAATGRRFDSAQLRDFRKSLDSPHSTQRDVDAIATLFIGDIIELSSDYIGNTLVQKFFERGSEEIKLALLERLAPFLAMIGTHKNGTWAAQKIIDCARGPQQLNRIVQHLQPYIPPLLLDQFGNYVVQCLLPYGSPISDCIFDAMFDRTWEIAQGRFGARSMRACLESSAVTKSQQKRVALAVIFNAVPLATNPNGALLLTWLLDTSEFTGRYRLLAPRFTPHLHHLCTHKLASLTVLRIITQSADPEASKLLVTTLFETGAHPVYEQILNDQIHGSQFIAKVLAGSAMDASKKPAYAEAVRKVLQDRDLINVPAYRRLVEEVGLAPSNSNSGGTGDLHLGKLASPLPAPRWDGLPMLPSLSTSTALNSSAWQRGPPQGLMTRGAHGHPVVPVMQPSATLSLPSTSMPLMQAPSGLNTSDAYRSPPQPAHLSPWAHLIGSPPAAHAVGHLHSWPPAPTAYSGVPPSALPPGMTEGHHGALAGAAPFAAPTNHSSSPTPLPFHLVVSPASHPSFVQYSGAPRH